MCAANTKKDSPPKSAQTSGRASGVRSGGLDSTGADPVIQTPSLLGTSKIAGKFRRKSEANGSEMERYNETVVQSICTVGPLDVAPTSANRAATAFATRYKLCAAGAASPCAATGFPVSPPMRMRGSISTSPSSGTPYSIAAFDPSPWPKISTGLPQCGQLNVLIFSTTPSTSTFTWRNISMALRTSASATVDGVVTTTAPVTATV